MPRRSAAHEVLERLHGLVQDLAPRAFVAGSAPSGTLGAHAAAAPDEPVPFDPAFLRGRDRWVFPRPGTRDQWETVAEGHPYLFLDAAEGGRIGLQVEGHGGVARLGRLFTPRGAARLDAFLDAAARMDPAAETAPVAVRVTPKGLVRERPLVGRSVATDHLGREVLRAVVATAESPPPSALGRHEVPAVRLVLGPAPVDDRAAARKAMRRTVALWRPVWDIPAPPEAPLRKKDLDARLARLYPRTLLLLGRGLDPQTHARLRVEARALDEAYRTVGGPRPKLLDQALARLGLGP